MLEIGSVIDKKYKILSVIGRGGMSVVYLALNEKANKTWAIKEVRKDGVRDFQAIKQGLLAEVNILKELEHKYLPSIVDVIDEDETILIVMDYIQGKSLDKIVKKSIEETGRAIQINNVIAWGKQLCEVFYYLHTRAQPIIYRDLKPGNIMLKPDGSICVIDFGTARHFKKGHKEDTICLGTPGYASPEQYGGSGQTTLQSDIYCLGSTLHHLITGRNPCETPFSFPKITVCRPALMDEIASKDKEKLLGLEIILNKCLQYQPEDRYNSCLELLYDLEHIEEITLPHRKMQKHKLQIFIVCAAAALCSGILFLGSTLLCRRMEKTGYDYYIEQAEKAEVNERIAYAKRAISLDPTKEYGYQLLLETLRNDADGFSAQDSQEIKALLLEETNGRSTNEGQLKTNGTGYARVAYTLGMAYYFPGGAGKPAGDKELAGKWFEIAAAYILEEKELKEFGIEKKGTISDTQLAKEHIDPLLLQTFLKICGYYHKLGVENEITGEVIYSYADFWKELNALLRKQPEEISTNSQIRLTQLRLLEDIALQLYTKSENFIDDAGVDEKSYLSIVSGIEHRVYEANTGSNQAACRVKENTLAIIRCAKEQAEALFAVKERG